MDNEQKINILTNNIKELKKIINLYTKYLKKLQNGHNIKYIPCETSYKEYQKQYYFNVLKDKRKNNKIIKPKIKNKYDVDNFFDNDNFIINISD